MSSCWVRSRAVRQRGEERQPFGEGSNGFVRGIAPGGIVPRLAQIVHGTLDVAYWAGPPISDYVVLSCKCIEVDHWIHLTATFDAAANSPLFAMIAFSSPSCEREMRERQLEADARG